MITFSWSNIAHSFSIYSAVIQIYYYPPQWFNTHNGIQEFYNSAVFHLNTASSPQLQLFYFSYFNKCITRPRGKMSKSRLSIQRNSLATWKCTHKSAQRVDLLCLYVFSSFCLWTVYWLYHFFIEFYCVFCPQKVFFYFFCSHKANRLEFEHKRVFCVLRSWKYYSTKSRCFDLIIFVTWKERKKFSSSIMIDKNFSSKICIHLQYRMFLAF